MTQNKPFAVFIVAQTGNQVCATTRAADRGESGKIGLPGGKVDAGEMPHQAALREAREEGWDIGNINPIPIHKALVEGKLVWWFEGSNATILTTFKEKGRIQPVLVSQEAIANSGYGNEFLKP